MHRMNHLHMHLLVHHVFKWPLKSKSLDWTSQPRQYLELSDLYQLFLGLSTLLDALYFQISAHFSHFFKNVDIFIQWIRILENLQRCSILKCLNHSYIWISLNSSKYSGGLHKSPNLDSHAAQSEVLLMRYSFRAYLEPDRCHKCKIYAFINLDNYFLKALLLFRWFWQYFIQMWR